MHRSSFFSLVQGTSTQVTEKMLSLLIRVGDPSLGPLCWSSFKSPWISRQPFWVLTWQYRFAISNGIRGDLSWGTMLENLFCLRNTEVFLPFFVKCQLYCDWIVIFWRMTWCGKHSKRSGKTHQYYRSVAVRLPSSNVELKIPDAEKLELVIPGETPVILEPQRRAGWCRSWLSQKTTSHTFQVS